jgi:hypothetical protein
MEETKNKLTNMEAFLFVIALGCVTLGVGYKSIILLGIAGLSAFLGFGSMFMRNKK